MTTVVNHSIFPNESVNWEEYLLELTPVEKIGSLWFKREDYFAPLGYGGINGSKLRQCIYLFSRHLSRAGVISGSSVKSPQISMSAIVAKRYGQHAIEVIGATKVNTAMQHENVMIGAAAGARFVINKVAYNPALQRKTLELTNRFPSYWRLEYGISMPKESSSQDFDSFHRLGADQVSNIPEHITDLVIPTGSGNSAISILYGIYTYRPRNLKRIYFMLIGPNKMSFVHERLNAINPRILPWLIENVEGNVFDLHGEEYATYQDEVQFEYNGIEFHPTYEAKCMKYLTEYAPELLSDTTCFWIIGSKPYLAQMLPYLGEVPDTLPLLEDPE